MARFNGASLFCLLSRRSLQNGRNASPHILDDALHRGLFSGAYKSPLLCEYVSFENVKPRNGVINGALRGSLGPTSFIHATVRVSMDVRDCYDILGVGKNASLSEIKRAYYELAKKLHPDTNENNSDVMRKFQEVQQAYEALKGHASDQSFYDHGCRGFAGGSDVFRSMRDILEKKGSKGLRGEDVNVSIELSLMEAVHGCSKTVSFETAVPCEACSGAGIPPGIKPKTCKPCTGSGIIFWQWQEGQFEFRYTCTDCWGSGIENFCKSCRGDGVVRGPKTVEIYVEPGTEDGRTLTLSKSGGADPKENQPGDLYITINVLLASSNVVPYAGISG